MELGASLPLNESALQLVKPTKGHGKRKTEFKLGKKVGEGAISGIDMSDTSWHLRGQGPDRQCAQCGAECWSVEPLRCGCCLHCWHPACQPAQLGPPLSVQVLGTVPTAAVHWWRLECGTSL